MKNNKDDIVMPQVINEGSTSMSARLKDGKNVNISGYDLQLNRFDCDDGITRTVNDFSEFTLSEEEMRSVIDMLHFFKAD